MSKKILASFESSTQITQDRWRKVLKSRVFLPTDTLSDVMRWGGEEGGIGTTIQFIEVEDGSQLTLFGKDLERITSDPLKGIVNHIS